jgi:CRISPR-associated protein Cmr1
MTRQLPNVWRTLEPKVELQTESRVFQTRTYTVITPLIGGGVQPRVNDVIPIRGSTLRGQLRFWWRAMRSGQFGSVQQLKQAEDILWGAASTPRKARPSLVQLAVHSVAAGVASAATIGEPGSDLGYGAFPLYERNKFAGTARLNVSFSLSIEAAMDWPEYAKGLFRATLAEEVSAALWAWETFGGIGARTRRGFGAITLTAVSPQHAFAAELPPTAQDRATALTVTALSAWLQATLAKYIQGTAWPQDVPHLSAAPRLRIIGPFNSAELSLKTLLAKLKRFRHQRPHNRGRNRWPEPDAIRELTTSAANYVDRQGKTHDHRQPIYAGAQITGPNNPLKAPTHRTRITKFPRAAFGLPINFEFKSDDRAGGDPDGKNTLSGQSVNGVTKYDRLASPLILRPLMYGSTVFGLAIVLDGSRLPPQLVIALGRGNAARRITVQADLTPGEAAQLTTPTGAQLLGGSTGVTTDVIQAFLDTL